MTRDALAVANRTIPIIIVHNNVSAVQGYLTTSSSSEKAFSPLLISPANSLQASSLIDANFKKNNCFGGTAIFQ